MTISWKTSDDIKTVAEDGEVTYTRGPEYEIEMSDSDQKIYKGAGIASVILVLAIVASVVGVVIT